MKVKFKFLAFFVICVLLFSACDFLDDASEEFIPNEFELSVFELTNIERAKHGLPNLIWHGTLAAVAREHSEDLMVNDMRGHTGSDGSTVRERVERAGIRDGRFWAENWSNHTRESGRILDGFAWP
jgi:uncharacterized protein YkwD